MVFDEQQSRSFCKGDESSQATSFSTSSRNSVTFAGACFIFETEACKNYPDNSEWMMSNDSRLFEVVRRLSKLKVS